MEGFFYFYQMKNFENLPKIIFILYLFIGFVPYFGSVDIIGPQWVYLSILNLISLFYILGKGDIFFNKYIFLSSISLLLFTLLSFLKSINISESIIEYTRIVIFLISVFTLFNLSTYISNFLSWILKLVFFALVFELLFFYFNYYLTFDTVVDRRGVAGNINITAMSLVIKLSLIISYLFSKNSRYFLNSIVIFFSFLDIFIIVSRTSFF